MKYNIKGKRFGNNILETVLHNRGIFDKELFINPDNSSDTDLNMITNIKKGIELIYKHLEGEILILVDSDCDGVTSGAMMLKFLKMINPDAKIKYYLHDEKRHGLTSEFMNYLELQEVDLIIVPDAGSNDIENIEKIEKAGIDILIIDHHEIEKKTECGVIINNQTCPNTNSNLTGAGMVLKVCEKMNEDYNYNLDELHNLAMLGLIGDTANLIDNEVRNICLTSIKDIKNNFLRTVYQMKEKDLDNLTMRDLSFGGVIPLINSVLRVGTLEERIKLFEVMADIVDPDKFTIIEKRKLNKSIRKYEMVPFTLNEYELMVEQCEEVKKRQNKLINKMMRDLEPQYNPANGIQFFIVGNYKEFKGITGLVAMKLSEKFAQPSIVAWLDDDGNYYGSLRGNEKVMPDFKEWCLNTMLFEWVQGHANASGLCIAKENVNQLMQRAGKVTPQEMCYEVDFEYSGNTPVDDVMMIGSNKGLWGNSCPEPVFITKGLRVPVQALQHSKNTLRFWVAGVTYIKFKTSEEEFEELRTRLANDNTLKLDVIGTFSINEYNNREYPQMVLNDYEVVEASNDNLFNIFF